MAASKAVLVVALAVAECIKEAGTVPSGHLYAAVCGTLSLEAYQSIITGLVDAGLVAQNNHELKWIGDQDESDTKSRVHS